MKNIKGQYLKKDLGDGTIVSVVNAKRPDDGTFALAILLRVGTRTATCFLEDVEAVSYVDELIEALQEYQADRLAMDEEETARRSKEHENLKSNRDKSTVTK
jgi:hypothetical protein